MKINLLIVKYTDSTGRPTVCTIQIRVSVTDMVETLPLMPTAEYNFQGCSSLMFLQIFAVVIQSFKTRLRSTSSFHTVY